MPKKKKKRLLGSNTPEPQQSTGRPVAAVGDRRACHPVVDMVVAEASTISPTVMTLFSLIQPFVTL